MMSTSGLIPKSTGSDWTDNVDAGAAFTLGVAAGYSPTGEASTGLPVYTDLRSTIFKVQCATTTLVWATSITLFRTFESTYTQGSTITGLSKQEMNATTTGYVRFLARVPEPNFSTSGNGQEIYVSIVSPGGDLYSVGASTN